MSIYKDLNDVHIDVKKYEEIPLSPLQEKQIIQRTQKKLNNKQPGKVKNKKYMFTAVASVAAASFLTLSLTVPAFAEKFNIMNLFDFFTNEDQYIFEEFNEHASFIGQVQEDNGIKITLNQAVYDKESLTIAYTINSEKDLGERPVLDNAINVEEYGTVNEDYIYSRNYLVEKISNFEYAVLEVYNFSYYDNLKAAPDTLHISWDGGRVANLNKGSQFTLGNWNFEFTLQSLESVAVNFADRNVQTTDTGIEIEVAKMTQSPISTTFYISEKVDERIVSQEEIEMRGVLIDYLVSDDLGNEYNYIHSRSTDHSTDFDANHISTPQIVLDPIHEEASYIYIKPVINVFKVENPDANGSGNVVPALEPFQIEPIRVPLNN